MKTSYFTMQPKVCVFRVIKFSGKITNFSCFIDIDSDVENIRTFYQNMLHGFRAVTSVVQGFFFRQVTLRYPLVTYLPPANDRLLFYSKMGEFFIYIQRFFREASWFKNCCQMVGIYVFTFDCRSDQYKCC